MERKLSPLIKFWDLTFKCFSFCFSLSLSSGNERSRESACSTTSLLPSTASRRSSGRLPVGREILLPESEPAPGCRWVFLFFLINAWEDTGIPLGFIQAWSRVKPKPMSGQQIVASFLKSTCQCVVFILLFLSHCFSSWTHSVKTFKKHFHS